MVFVRLHQLRCFVGLTAEFVFYSNGWKAYYNAYAIPCAEFCSSTKPQCAEGCYGMPGGRQCTCGVDESLAVDGYSCVINQSRLCTVTLALLKLLWANITPNIAI